MDDPALSSSPRKKLKMDDNSSLPLVMNEDVIPMQSLNKEEKPVVQLTKEAEVGITEFVSPELSGFTGILKKRYTDFLVNEILPSGQVVHLDDLKVPKSGNAVKESIETELSSEHLHGEQAKQDSHPGALSSENLTGTARSAANPAVLHKDKTLECIIDKADAPLELQDVDLITAIPAVSMLSDVDQKPELTAKEQQGIKGAVEAKTDEANALAGWQSYSKEPEGLQLTPKDSAILNSFFDAKTVDLTLALFNKVINSPHRKAKDYGTVDAGMITDRELRTKIHQEIRRIFSSRLDSSTDGDGNIVISSANERGGWGAQASGRGARGSRGRSNKSNNNNNRQSQLMGKIRWKELGGEYLHFTLYKENKDTMEVISYLARELRVRPKAFDFAGTKDRRAVTVQRVSVHRLNAQRVVWAGRTLRNAKIGNYEYLPQGLELGELTGNEFVITLRDCQFADISAEGTGRQVQTALKIVETAAQHLSEKGFINYFGLQRFGTFSTRTDTIGVKMLQGDYKGAVEAILDFDPVSLAAAQGKETGDALVSSDDKRRAFALDVFKSKGDSHEALQDLPRKFSAESSIVRYLGNRNKASDYLGAMQSISRNLRLMYVHAYQSLVWNAAASERWKTYGDRVIEGDLILIDEHLEKVDEPLQAEEVDADGEIIVQPGADDSSADPEEGFIRARSLTKEEAESGQYTIFDIVLPTPGYDILYPAYLETFYKTFMSSEQGGGLDLHDMRRGWKDISLSGSYRKIVVKPHTAITCSVHAYSDDNEKFVETDDERLMKKKSEEEGETKGNAANIKNNGIVDQGNATSEWQKLAVVLTMQLGASQYATMALRELMKLGGVKMYKPDYGGGR